jgi:hypothetical protein
MRRDAITAQMIRAAHHGQSKDFDPMIKKLTQQGT